VVPDLLLRLRVCGARLNQGMGRFPRILVAVGLVIGLTSGSALAQATTPPVDPQRPQGSQAQTAAPPDRPTAPPDLTTDLQRIKEGLSRPQVLKLQQDGLRFYLTIIGNRLDLGDYLRNSDLKNGPVPRAGVTHQDFLNHITPKILYSSGGIKATELLEWGIVDWLGKMAVKKIFNEITEARRAAQIRSIREQIDRELAALKGKEH
jgi:hypothetical protein